MNENQPTGAPEDQEDFETLLEQSVQDSGRLEPGQMVQAAIVKIASDWIFIDVGRKGEGYLDRKEMLDEAGNLTVKEGDKVRAYYLPSPSHEMHFTTKIGSGPGAQAQLEDAWKSGIPVQGTVAKEVKGGFEVRIGGGARAFCPFSQMGLRRDENQAECIGKSFTFKITECAARNVVLSRKAILDVERQGKAQSLRDSLKEGMRVKGTVTSIQKFGAFLDVGGVDGLIPVSEIAWGRTEKVGDALSVGQTVEVVIKKLDWENNKLSFSLKDTLPDPWHSAAQTWPVGTYQNGTVTRLAPFGAFVALGGGVEGLIHISKLGGGRRINHPREVLKEGQEIEVRVEAVDPENRKLSLSLASLSRAEEEEAADLKAYLDKSSDAAAKSLGTTLGDLLKAKLEKRG
ncbi:MAG: 30S ribosomal protein S1 [Elusimicrobia bacterium]|nr:30S ribosomal protein S1 [Elusimicrobiota bacterium]